MQPYETVVKCMQGLKTEAYTTRNDFTEFNKPNIERILKANGCRFWKTKAQRITEFGSNPINLKTATREELVSDVKGVGMKLASMFLRDTRNADLAVMDVHTKRWLAEQLEKRGVPYPKRYEDEEKWMLQLAKEQGTTIRELDYKIWDAGRIGNR